MTLFYDPVLDQFFGRQGGIETVLAALPVNIQNNITRLGTLTNGPTGFSAGSVVFHNGTTLAQDNANLFWDDTNNRLGIGTSAPVTSIHVDGKLTLGVPAVAGTSPFDAWGLTPSTSGMSFTRNQDVGLGPFIFLRLYREGAIVQSEDHLGKIRFQGWDGSSAFRTAASIDGTVDTGTPSSTSMPGRIAFAMCADGSLSLVERLRIDGRANLSLGAPSLPTTGTMGLIFNDGTALSGMGSNSAGIFADDVGGTVNMFAINEANQVTRLTYGTPQTYTETNVTTDRSFDASATTLGELANVVGTLLGDLRARGIVA